MRKSQSAIEQEAKDRVEFCDRAFKLSAALASGALAVSFGGEAVESTQIITDNFQGGAFAKIAGVFAVTSVTAKVMCQNLKTEG